MSDMFKKGHETINYFNRIDFSKYPTTHGRELSPTGPSRMKNASANPVSFGNAMTVSYPDSSATSYVTHSGNNIESLLLMVDLHLL